MTSGSLDPTELVHGKTFLTGLQLIGGVLTAKRMRGCFFCFPAIFLGRAKVSERLEIDANSRFMVTYNSDNNIVKVCDDLEVNEFMEFVVKSSRIVTLCIAECSVNGRQSSTTGSKQQSNFIHATPSVNVYQTEYHATQIHQTQMHVFPGSSGLIYQNLPCYQQMHGFSENLVYVPGFLGYLMQDHQSDSANNKSKQVVGSLKHKKPSVFREVKRLASKDESSEFDDESSESDEEGSKSDEDEKTTPVENKNCKVDKFWSMPPLLKTPVFDLKKKVAMDGNNQISPLAYRVGKSKTFRSWDWFLRKLKECIIDFEERFSTLRNWLPSVANKLDMIGLEKWARVHFPSMRYNYMTSNSAESSVNALS
nr:hypothetical protein [Tanacetum cinerariifolium]